MSDQDVAVLGVGHAPVGQVGPQLRRVRHGRGPRRAGRRRHRSGPTCSSSPAPTPCATATPATWPAPPSPRRSAGPAPASRRPTRPARRAPPRIEAARTRILAGLCDVALVVGADTTPKGFLAPTGGDRPDDPGLAALPPARRHQPDLLRALRPPPHGPLRRHRRGLRPGQGQERPPRPGQPQRPLPQGGHGRGGAGVADGGRPAAPARDLRHLRRRRRGGAHAAWSSPAATTHGDPVRIAARLHGDADLPQHDHRPARLRHRLGRRRRAAPDRTFKAVDRPRRLRGGRHRPRGPRRWPRSTTCPPPSSSTGTRTSASARPARPSSSCATATPRSAGASRSTPAAGWPASARPSRPRPSPRSASSPGSCGARPTGRQVEGATVGVTANQGLFGHGSSVVLVR